MGVRLLAVCEHPDCDRSAELEFRYVEGRRITVEARFALEIGLSPVFIRSGWQIGPEPLIDGESFGGPTVSVFCPRHAPGHVHEFRPSISRVSGWEMINGYHCRCGARRPFPDVEWDDLIRPDVNARSMLAALRGRVAAWRGWLPPPDGTKGR